MCLAYEIGLDTELSSFSGQYLHGSRDAKERTKRYLCLLILHASGQCEKRLRGRQVLRSTSVPTLFQAYIVSTIIDGVTILCFTIHQSARKHTKPKTQLIMKAHQTVFILVTLCLSILGQVAGQSDGHGVDDPIVQALEKDLITIFQNACDPNCCGKKEEGRTSVLPCCNSCDGLVNFNKLLQIPFALPRGTILSPPFVIAYSSSHLVQRSSASIFSRISSQKPSLANSRWG